jgi:hypothetical protein
LAPTVSLMESWITSKSTVLTTALLNQVSWNITMSRVTVPITDISLVFPVNHTEIRCESSTPLDPSGGYALEMSIGGQTTNTTFIYGIQFPPHNLSSTFHWWSRYPCSYMQPCLRARHLHCRKHLRLYSNWVHWKRLFRTA